MGKDPAVLFYTSDFLTGTMMMTDEQAGQYIRLLCLQHQKGFLTEKDMIKICKSYDEDIFSKFEKEGEKFFNKRLIEETEKRKRFTEGRKNNLKGKIKIKNNSHMDDHMGDHMVKHMASHVENENENENRNINTIKKEPKKSKSKDHLFVDSEFYEFEKFEDQFNDSDYAFCDLKIYHEKVKNWSASKGMKRIDWIATARNFMIGDKEKGKLILRAGTNEPGKGGKFQALIDQTQQMKELNKKIYGE